MYGFSPRIMTDADVPKLRKRVALLAIVLLLISIPLIYTLHMSIAEIQLRGKVENALKQEFNTAQRSGLSRFNYIEETGGVLEVHAVINTVRYLTEQKISRAEKDLRSFLNKDVHLTVEQVLVQSGGIKEKTPIKEPLSPSIAPATAQPEAAKASKEGLIAATKETVNKINNIISPSVVTGFNVMFDDKKSPVFVTVKIKRDSTLPDEQELWLKRMFTEGLTVPVNLKVETMPFVPDLVFNVGATSLSDEMKKQLLSVRDVYLAYNNIIITINSYPESSLSYQKRIKLATERAEAVTVFLTKDFNIPASQIRTVIEKQKAVKEPRVKVSIDVTQAKP